MLVLGLGAAIVGGYALALWWVLRRERAWTCAALAALCGVSLALRLVLTEGYPFGLFEDEPKFLECAVAAVQRGAIAGESCVHIPYLLPAVFQAPLVPLAGISRWSIRSYAIVTSVLATPGIFGAARAMGMRLAPALLAGGLVAVLPWAIFYGRIALGGELIFHQALLLGGLAGLVWQRGGWRDALLAGFGLCLLLWDYWAGRAMMTLPLVAAVLASGWRRLWCVAVMAIALAGWAPHLMTGPLDAHVGLSLRGAQGATTAGGFNAAFAEDPLGALQARTQMALRAFTGPYAFDSIFTMRAVAWHPTFVLALAGVGLLRWPRRGLFLLGGFALGILPGIASGSHGISAHRIMMAYAFVALAAASAVDILTWRHLRRGAAALALLAAATWSVPLYFSDRFWPPEWRWTVDAERTALGEALAADPAPRVIFSHHLGFHANLGALAGRGELLTLANWLPDGRGPVTYAFTDEAAPLRGEYERLFPRRVRSVGRGAFLVAVEPGDWSALRRHGWWYELHCDGQSGETLVPFLYNLNLRLPDVRCAGEQTHVWRARWTGPPVTMRLHYSGAARVASGATVVGGEGYERQLTVPVASGAVLEIAVTTPPHANPRVFLYEESAAGPRVPAWETLTPEERGERRVTSDERRVMSDE